MNVTGSPSNSPRTDADSALFGAATVALLDGVNLQLLADPAGLSAEAATAIADDHLAR